MRRYLLAALALAFAAFMAWGCAEIHQTVQTRHLVDAETFWALWPDSTEVGQ